MPSMKWSQDLLMPISVVGFSKNELRWLDVESGREQGR